MNIPKQTSCIFNILSKGKFICSNSNDNDIKTYYNIIDSDNNFEILKEYFSHINFVLERGDEFFYFSRKETNANLENKIQKAYKWIDYLDFFKTFDNAFSSGFRFDIYQIINKIKIDAELEGKLNSLNKDKKNIEDFLKDVVDEFVKDYFIELVNQLSGEYKVLASFKYLEDLIMAINIEEEN